MDRRKESSQIYLRKEDKKDPVMVEDQLIKQENQLRNDKIYGEPLLVQEKPAQSEKKILQAQDRLKYTKKLKPKKVCEKERNQRGYGRRKGKPREGQPENQIQKQKVEKNKQPDMIYSSVEEIAQKIQKLQENIGEIDQRKLKRMNKKIQQIFEERPRNKNDFQNYLKQEKHQNQIQIEMENYKSKAENKNEEKSNIQDINKLKANRKTIQEYAKEKQEQLSFEQENEPNSRNSRYSDKMQRKRKEQEEKQERKRQSQLKNQQREKQKQLKRQQYQLQKEKKQQQRLIKNQLKEEKKQQQRLIKNQLKEEKKQLKQQKGRNPSELQSSHLSSIKQRKIVSQKSAMKQVPEYLFCPITQSLMQSPFLLKLCGHTFQEKVIRQWLARQQRCPLCNEQAQANDLIKNFALAQVCSSFK